jgi:hypothetical protein
LDLVGGFGAAERLGVVVPVGQEADDGPLQHATLPKLPRRMAWLVINANQRSTRLSTFRNVKMLIILVVLNFGLAISTIKTDEHSQLPIPSDMSSRSIFAPRAGSGHFLAVRIGVFVAIVHVLLRCGWVARLRFFGGRFVGQVGPKEFTTVQQDKEWLANQRADSIRRSKLGSLAHHVKI